MKSQMEKTMEYYKELGFYMLGLVFRVKGHRFKDVGLSADALDICEAWRLRTMGRSCSGPSERHLWVPAP